MLLIVFVSDRENDCQPKLKTSGSMSPYASVAQLVEHLIEAQGVSGSIPFRRTKFFSEHLIRSDACPGSSPSHASDDALTGDAPI